MKETTYRASLIALGIVIKALPFLLSMSIASSIISFGIAGLLIASAFLFPILKTDSIRS